MNFSYRQQALASANPVELVVALYDGAIRFLEQALVAVEVKDVGSRRRAVKRALDIYLHLQSRLRYDIDVRVASALSQFYTEMFHHTLMASYTNSREGFEQVIAHISQVKDAWRAAAHDPRAIQALERGHS